MNNNEQQYNIPLHTKNKTLLFLSAQHGSLAVMVSCSQVFQRQEERFEFLFKQCKQHIYRNKPEPSNHEDVKKTRNKNVFQWTKYISL